MFKKGYYKVCSFLLLVSIVTIEGIFAQTIDLQLAGKQDCSTNTYCVSIQAQTNANELNIGTSSIFLQYNTDALSYFNYTSTHFDGSDQCIQNMATAWDVQTYDATSAPGYFNVTMTLLTNKFSCPAIQQEAVEIGVICFNIVDDQASPAIKVIKNNTGFNSSTPNTGAKLIPIGEVSQIMDRKVLQCVTTQTTDCDYANQKELWDQEKVAIKLENCDDLATFCTGISFNNQSSYDLLVNGMTTLDTEECETGQVTCFYTYSSLLKLEEGGEFELLNWTVNGATHTGTFKNTTELQDLLNSWDSNGNWLVNTNTNAIEGGLLTQTYGPIEIKNVEKGLAISMGLNKKVADFATGIPLATGVHIIQATNRYTGCEDIIEVTVNCSVNRTAERGEDKVAQSITIFRDTLFCLTDIIAAESFIEDCSDQAGTSSELQVDNQTQCLSIMANVPGLDEYCLYICDTEDNCITYHLAVEVVENLEPVLRNDQVSVMMNEELTIEVKDNDIINGSILDFGVPYQEMTGQADADTHSENIIYTPAYDVCGIQDSFQYFIANERGKGIATVMVEVLCEELTVFSGFSPNGDGVNDYFKIMGIEKFQDSELLVFNSRGNEIYSKVGYQNEDGWDGTWKGKTLPDGTYFYILSLKGQNPMSGYVQLHR